MSIYVFLHVYTRIYMFIHVYTYSSAYNFPGNVLSYFVGLLNPAACCVQIFGDFIFRGIFLFTALLSRKFGGFIFRIFLFTALLSRIFGDFILRRMFLFTALLSQIFSFLYSRGVIVGNSFYFIQEFVR